MAATAQSNAATATQTRTITKNILILQGGGALGAYECGVYRALAESAFLDDLVAVAGTSIGGINAALIARHFREARHGAGALEHFWRDYLANPSWAFFTPPFFPPTDYWERWNAVWTSLLTGHPHLFRPHSVWPVPWIFRAPLSWVFETHFYDAGPLEELLSRSEIFAAYRGDDPRLIVTAVNVVDGTSIAFDSGKEQLTAAHLVASASLPPSYPPKQLHGEYFWDGGIWSNTPLHEVLAVLRSARGRHHGAGQETRYRVCIVDALPKKAPRVPATNGEVYQRLSELTYADKTHDDVTAVQWINEYIDLVLTLQAFDQDLPQALKDTIARLVETKQLHHYQQILNRTRIHVDITTIAREAYPDAEAEQISSGIDFSGARIEELLEQGYRAGKAHLRSL